MPDTSRRAIGPALRHHPARRHPARGALAVGGRQGEDRPRPGPARRALHRGRLARVQPQGRRVLPPDAGGARRPGPGSPRSAAPGGPASPARTTATSAHWRRRRRRSSPWSARPRRCTWTGCWRPRARRTSAWWRTASPGSSGWAGRWSTTPSTSSTAGGSTRPMPSPRSRPRRMPARTCSCSAIPTEGSCPMWSPSACSSCATASAPRSASTRTTTPGLAVANALAAVRAGCVQVQGTINGYGERCGNLDLVPLVATLQLKLGYRLLLGRRAPPAERGVALRGRGGQPASRSARARTSAAAPSPTRAAFTSPRSPRCPRATSTWTPAWWAMRAGWW